MAVTFQASAVVGRGERFHRFDGNNLPWGIVPGQAEAIAARGGLHGSDDGHGVSWQIA